MDFDTKTYILLGGCLLIGLVLLHGFWLAWRRRPVTVLEGGHGGQQMPLDMEAALLGENDDGPTAMQRAEPVPEDPTRPVRAALARRQQVAEGNGAEARSRRGRRIEIAGKRTEPTVPRTARRFAAKPVAPAPVVETEYAVPDEPPSLENGAEAEEVEGEVPADEILVLWVVARPDDTLAGATMLQTFATAGLEYDGQVFRGAVADGGRFTVANGVEPGTFDLSDMEAFDTRGVVFLQRLSTDGDPAAVFDAMLETAQALAADCDAELKDEQRSDVSGQTIVYYRQRIDDFKHVSMRG